MNTQNMIWKPLTMDFNPELNDALQQQHHAAQFIALVGRHLIPRQADDSNTNMQYIFDGDLLLGNALPNGMRVALRLTDLEISILDKENIAKKVIALEGKTRKEVFDELKQTLSDSGIDVSGFKNELHYEIPSHQLDMGAVFSVRNKYHLVENTLYRHNAEIVIRKIANAYDHSEPVRVWPHHFDTGSFIPVLRNKKDELTQSIGIGWAMPDGMVNEPYYYLSFWSEKPDGDLKTMPALTAGQWMIPNWNGAVLKQSEILQQDSAEKQSELVESFYRKGIEILLTYFSK